MSWRQNWKFKVLFNPILWRWSQSQSLLSHE